MKIFCLMYENVSKQIKNSLALQFEAAKSQTRKDEELDEDFH